jgi:ribosomal-protein-alanine N-acetyltransferase
MQYPILITDKFNLRQAKIADADDIQSNLNDQEVTQYMRLVSYPYSKQDAIDWLTKTIGESKEFEPNKLDFIIEIEGKAAGAISISLIASHKARIGYWIGKHYWGKGIMTDVVKIATDYAFQEFNLKRIEANVFSENLASKRVLEKNGFL